MENQNNDYRRVPEFFLNDVKQWEKDYKILEYKKDKLEFTYFDTYSFEKEFKEDYTINIIGDVAVPISLSLRLFANVLSGTVMLALVYALLAKIAYIWPAALHVYFDLFSGAIQTYVFCMLTMTYISDAIGDE